MSLKHLILPILLGLALTQNITVRPINSPGPNGLIPGTEWVFTNYTVTCDGNTSTSNYFPTAVLPLNVINITLADLPAPYATESVAKGSRRVDLPENATLNVPAGFQVNLFASNLSQSRWLALTPDGNVLVTQTYVPSILLMQDTNGNGVADSITEFANESNGLNKPFGMAFADGYFFLGNTDGIYRFNYTTGQAQLNGTGEKIIDLPPNGNHWTRNVRVSPDGQSLYITCGSASNVDIEEAPRATILRSNLDGTNLTVFASGLRNANGLDFHPVTGEVYTVVNERDELGDDLVPDYFTRVLEGQFYGWPYAYLSPENIDPRLTQTDANGTEVSVNASQAALTVTPDVLFGAHSASLGTTFYNNSVFPAEYQNGAFAALHGSWNRDSATGYKIVYIPFGDDDRPLGDYEDFVTGFVVNASIPTVWGRPVGIISLPDGSLIFTDDDNGRIYRVSYNAGLNCTVSYDNTSSE